MGELSWIFWIGKGMELRWMEEIGGFKSTGLKSDLRVVTLSMKVCWNTLLAQSDGYLVEKKVS